MYQPHDKVKSGGKSKHEYSPKIAERRRALFQTNNNNGDDLNDMAPIVDSYAEGCPIQTDANVFSSNNKQSAEVKARTVLFPSKETCAIPTGIFYKKGDTNAPALKRSIKVIYAHNKTNSVVTKRAGSHCRKHNYGEINAGVKHKIRKAKKPELRKSLILKAAENIIDNSPLNDYFQKNGTDTITDPDSSDEEHAALNGYIKILSEFNLIPLNEASSDNMNDRTETPIKLIQPAIPSISNRNTNIAPKRSPSPLPESDTNRKFFKSSRLKSLSASRQSKLAASTSKLASSSDKIGHLAGHGLDLELDMSDLEWPTNESLITNDKLGLLIDNLEDKENLQEHHDALAMSNNKLLHKLPGDTEQYKGTNINKSSVKMEMQHTDLLMSPTTQMCDMASDLVISSPPRKARNLSNLMEGLAKDQPSRAAVMKKFKNISKNQMMLDAGQKVFGVTQCPECKFIYHVGDPGDELLHLDHHSGSSILRFNGWKNERIVGQLDDGGKIIQVIPNDPKPWLKKVKELLDLINRDLGYFDNGFNIDNSQVFLYSKNRMVVGCLVAETAIRARKMLTESTIDVCSEETYPVKCGVSRIWVLEAYRNKHIASMLMDALKRSFLYGSVLTNLDIAFSSPTASGRKFAEKYFGTANFFVYSV